MGDVVRLCIATPCFLLITARAVAQPALVINEILYAPANAQNEFVELINQSGRPLDLCEFSISDNRDAPSSLCDDHQIALFLSAGDYILLSRDSLALFEGFPDFDGHVLFPPDWPALNNSGDAVKIMQSDEIIDEVVYDADWGGNRVSLERRDPTGPSQAAFNWGSSTAPAGATPGRQNSIYAPDVDPPGLLLAEVTAPTSITLIWNEDLDVSNLSITQFIVDDQSPASLSVPSTTRTILFFDTPISAREITLDGITDLTGNPSAVVQFPLARVPTWQDLQINEIMYAPRADPDDHQPDQVEYIELLNTSGQTLSLRHLTLAGAPDELNRSDTLHHVANLPYPYIQMISNPYSDLYNVPLNE